jgi:hypothetical protein
MTTPKSLSDEERNALLRDLTSLRTDDDDAVAQDPKWFLPLDAHARALRPETLVVRGGRGAGKTALFHFLGHVRKDPSLGASASLPSVGDTEWVEGFSTAIDHPNGDAVGAFAETASDARRRHFWFGWLCLRIGSVAGIELPTSALHDAAQDPAQIADVVGSSLSVLSSWLDGIERSRGGALVFTYDGLDRIGTSPASRERLTASLLAMWLALTDRYRRIRPKIFVREDLFAASTSAFPDASKLEARSVSLEWRTEDLYRVLIKHMANLSEGLRAWIEGSSRGIPLQDQGSLGWMPPATLPEKGRISQKAFVDHLAGEKMGSGEKKGFAYRWIPNRLQDAHARVVPRSILSLVRNAASGALARSPKAQNLRLLHPEELQGALEDTSSRRVKELKEEFKVVARLEHLRGRTVMLDRKVVVNALSQPTDEPDGHGEDGERVLRTLLDLGVMSVRRLEQRIDVPDIYRYGFGIKRKGGVKASR